MDNLRGVCTIWYRNAGNITEFTLHYRLAGVQHVGLGQYCRAGTVWSSHDPARHAVAQQPRVVLGYALGYTDSYLTLCAVEDGQGLSARLVKTGHRRKQGPIWFSAERLCLCPLGGKCIEAVLSTDFRDQVI